MKKQLKEHALTVSAYGKTEILGSLMREYAVVLLIESDALPGSQEFPGVRFVRSYGTKVARADILPPHVVTELQRMGLHVTNASHITVGEMKDSGKYFGTVIIVVEPEKRTAVLRKLSKDDYYLYDEIRKYLV